MPPSDEPQTPTADSAFAVSAPGLAMLAIIVIGVALWMYVQGPTSGVSVEGVRPAPLSDRLEGFRADAWFLPDDDRLGFVEIPAGPFTMGGDPSTDPRAFENERWSTSAAQGTVDLPAFLIGRYEVTVAQFASFVAATGFPLEDAQILQRPLDHPVTAVTWPDALAYCRWLDATLRNWSGTPPDLADRLHQGWHVTLPSEAEWEKGARGTDGRIYPWGDDPRHDRANFQGTATRPVGSYDCPECAFGLLDMSGNAWEWTRSPYQPYPWDPTDDRTHLEADALWVMRGGHFGDPERYVRAAVRGAADPGVRRPFIGFRLAVSR